MPGDYPEKPAEALVMFWRRYLEILVYEGSIRMCRMSMGEIPRASGAAFRRVVHASPSTSERLP